MASRPDPGAGTQRPAVADLTSHNVVDVEDRSCPGSRSPRGRSSISSSEQASSRVKGPTAVRRSSDQMGAPAQRRAEVCSQRADIGARRAVDGEVVDQRIVGRGDVEPGRCGPTSRFPFATSLPSRASSWSRFPSTFTADTIGGTLFDVADEALERLFLTSSTVTSMSCVATMSPAASSVLGLHPEPESGRCTACRRR